MNVSPRKRLFHHQSQNNIYRMFAWAILIVLGLWIVYGVDRGNIQPMGRPTVTPTRASVSFADEGDAHFQAGNIDKAIEAYKRATTVDPYNAQIWAKLARIQTYSSALKTTDSETRAVLSDALFSIAQAKALAPEDSTVTAINAFVLDWNANPVINGEDAADYLARAEQEALRAISLDNTNTLALVFYAEILIDQLKLTQAEQNLQQAFARNEDMMDLHRVNANLLESYGQYSEAISEYNKAIDLAPNLTFLHLRAGANYRQLAFISTIPEQQKQLYERSLEYFAKAASINGQLGVLDPIPYLSIAKTYSQTGDYFAAALNVQKALDFRPEDPDIYGQLGVVFRKSRNYEGSIMAFKCAIDGCNPEESCFGRYGRECDPDFGEAGVNVSPLELSSNTIVYYYSYASNLAALSRPRDNKCPEARRIMDEIIAGGFGSDTVVNQILAENEAICQIVDKGGRLALLTPTVIPDGTPQPASDVMIELTPTPSPTPSPTP